MSFFKKLNHFNVFSTLLLGAAVFFVIFPFLSDVLGDSVQTGFVTSTGRVVVIDAGHGGEDGGAVSPDGTAESALNLDIARKLDSIMGFYGASAVMTRDSEEIEYPKDAKTVKSRKRSDVLDRTKLVNAYPSALLISIHQNKYQTSQPSGAQVFYSNTKGSSELAVYTQDMLRQLLDANNNRKAKPISKDIYLMNNISCPAILVECGFLSNPKDTALLKTGDYRTKIAYSIACAYFSYFGAADDKQTGRN
jgi:N-acetylmuramoyl-L-alanine amidase